MTHMFRLVSLSDRESLYSIVSRCIMSHDKQNVSCKLNESSHSIVTISDNESIYAIAYHIIRMIPTLRPVSKRSRESYDWMVSRYF